MKNEYTIISGLLLLIGIAVSVFLWFQVKNQVVTFDYVNVQVVGVEESRPNGYKGSVEYKVTARHEGEEKVVHNVSNAYMFVPGGMVQVVEANGVLYADEDGAKTSTNTALYYLSGQGKRSSISFRLKAEYQV